MLIIDAHEDIAYNALEWGRDIRDSVHVVRAREGRTECCDTNNASAIRRHTIQQKRPIVSDANNWPTISNWRRNPAFPL